MHNNILFENKEKIAEELKKYISNPKKPEYFFHMSDINKLGINPLSSYETPLGIYAYPMTEHTYDALVNQRLPFAGERKFILIFKAKNPQKVIFSSMEDIKSTYNIYSKKTKYENNSFSNKLIIESLQNLFVIINSNKKDKIIDKFLEYFILNYYDFFEEKNNLKLELKNISVINSFVEHAIKLFKDISEKEILNTAKTVFNIIKIFISKSYDRYNFRYPVHVLWSLTYGLAKEYDKSSLLKNKKTNSATSSWGSIFRSIGIHGFVDTEKFSMIHANEPTQAVFFSKEYIKLIDIFQNKFYKIKNEFDNILYLEDLLDIDYLTLKLFITIEEKKYYKLIDKILKFDKPNLEIYYNFFDKILGIENAFKPFLTSKYFNHEVYYKYIIYDYYRNKKLYLNFISLYRKYSIEKIYKLFTFLSEDESVKHLFDNNSFDNSYVKTFLLEYKKYSKKIKNYLVIKITRFCSDPEVLLILINSFDINNLDKKKHVIIKRLINKEGKFPIIEENSSLKELINFLKKDIINMKNIHSIILTKFKNNIHWKDLIAELKKLYYNKTLEESLYNRWKKIIS